MTFCAILWRDWIVFRKKWISTSLAAIIGPTLYLIAFGWGLSDSVRVDGMSYTAFVIPGIVAMNAMTSSFNFIANDINLSRIYGKTFEATMISPITSWSYTLAKITAGALRGLYSAALILLVSLLFAPGFVPGGYFLLCLLLNCCVFSSFGVICGMCIDSHADMAKVSSFIITPMSFLCGTFFPLERFPEVLRRIFEILPLTQAVKGMRGGAEAGMLPAVILLAWTAALIPAAAAVCRRTE